MLAEPQEVRPAYRIVSLRRRSPPALPGCGVGMAERIHAGLRKMHLVLVVLLAPASQGAPGVCVEDVPDGLPMTCTAMDAATPALSCSTLYRMGYQCCPQCGPCGEHGSLCSSGSSGAPFFSITLLFLLLGAIFVCGFGAIVTRIANELDDCCPSEEDGIQGLFGKLFFGPIFLIIIAAIAGVIVLVLSYLLVTFVIAGAAGMVFGSASSVWLAAAASLILLPLMISWCHDQQERRKHEQERRKHAAAERARAMLLKHGPAKAEEKVNGWQPGQWQQFYFALRPHSGTTAAALLWWKDAAAFGEGSEHGGDPNNGKELGQFSLRGATLTCPPPSKSREPGSLFRKQVKRLELRRRDAQLEHELVLIFRVGKEDAAAAEWEAALRRALAPSAQQGASSAPPTSTPPPRIPVVTGTPVEPPRIEEKPAAAGKQRKALELV